MEIWEVDKALLFLVLVLPGFISIKVYSVLIATEAVDFSKSLIDAVCYSALNFGVLAFPLFYLLVKYTPADEPAIYGLALLGALVVFPVIWPILYLRLIKFPRFKRKVVGPHKQPWDSVFSQQEAMWVIVHLKSGGTVRGIYGIDSFTSLYPSERQIYVEELWAKGEKASFGKKISRSKGAIISEDEIKYIEFYK